MLAGVATKLDLAQVTAILMGPAPVIPGTGHQKVLVVNVILLEQFVDLVGPVKVFLVPQPVTFRLGTASLRGFKYGAKACFCQNSS